MSKKTATQGSLGYMLKLCWLAGVGHDPTNLAGLVYSQNTTRALLAEVVLNPFWVVGLIFVDGTDRTSVVAVAIMHHRPGVTKLDLPREWQ